MKTRSSLIQVILGTGAILVASGCSSMPEQATTGKEIAATGPNVMNVRLEPSTIELNRDLQPIKTPEVLADVKDFRGKITDVRVRFLHVPIQVPMQNVGGTTWRAELTPQQLKMLAVSGKTITYDAIVEARDEKGNIATNQNPISVAIKAPDLSQGATG